MSRSAINFKQKRVWVVGASAGIGQAVAEKLDAEGAQLILTARNQQALDYLNAKLDNKHQVVVCDINDQDALQQAFSTISQQKIDSIIYLPAIYQPMTFANMDLDAMRKIIEANLTAVFVFIHVVLAHVNLHRSQLAIVGSVAGYVGLPNAQPYGATKAGVINLVESLQSEYPKLDIRLISPGFVKTRLTDKNQFEMPALQTPEQAGEAIVKGLQKKSFEIHFPTRFTRFLKLLRWLPYRAQLAITQKFK